jgi:SAM-dependent methyltransferase
VQVRITKKGDAQVHRAAAVSAAPVAMGRPADRDTSDGGPRDGGPRDGGPRDGSPRDGGPRDGSPRDGGPSDGGPSDGGPSDGGPSDGGPSDGRLSHDRVKQRLLDPGDPLFAVIGGNAAKRRQVDAFLRALAATLPSELPPTLRVVDLGCGNAYLTFAAYRYLAGRGVSVRVVGVDVREDQRVRNTAVAAELGCSDDVTFVAGTISDAELPFSPDLVLALHACDTATDEALARAVNWSAKWILAAPCCHHDIAAQLKGRPAPAPFGELTRHAIMRERFADVLTDSLRASLLRLNGYKVDVVEFIDSAHTPRNLMLRARQTGATPTPAQRDEYDALITEWGVTPALSTMLS